MWWSLGSAALRSCAVQQRRWHYVHAVPPARVQLPWHTEPAAANDAPVTRESTLVRLLLSWLFPSRRKNITQTPQTLHHEDDLRYNTVKMGHHQNTLSQPILESPTCEANRTPPGALSTAPRGATGEASQTPLQAPAASPRHAPAPTATARRTRPPAPGYGAHLP